MKNLYILIFLLCASVCSAQDQRLFDNDWFLQKLTMNGTNYEAPSNAEIPFIQLYIFQDSFETSVCEGLMGVELTISNSNINVAYYAILIDEPCDLEENNTFQSLYYYDFFKTDLQDKNFAYVIENDGNFLSLILTNEDGNKAYYGNEPLAIQAYEKPQFSIYPNPVIDELILKASKGTQNLKIKIYTIEGKLVNAQNLNFEKQASINVSSLSKGIYFLNIETEGGKVETKKFVKD